MVRKGRHWDEVVPLLLECLTWFAGMFRKHRCKLLYLSSSWATSTPITRVLWSFQHLGVLL